MDIFTLSVRIPLNKTPDSGKLILRANSESRADSVTAFFEAKKDYPEHDIFLTGCASGADERQSYDILREIRKRD